MNKDPNPFEPRNEGERRTFERSREEVEHMNADFEREQRFHKMNQRLGHVASQLSEHHEIDSFSSAEEPEKE